MSTISVAIVDDVLKKINKIVYEQKQAAISRPQFRPVFTQAQQAKIDELLETKGCDETNAYTDTIVKEQRKMYDAGSRSPSRIGFVYELIARGLAEYERETAAKKDERKTQTHKIAG